MCYVSIGHAFLNKVMKDKSNVLCSVTVLYVANGNEFIGQRPRETEHVQQKDEDTKATDWICGVV